MASEVPVIKPSGFSGFVINPADTGSVTAENTRGISGAAAAAACAEGVAIATIKSFLSPAKVWQIDVKFDCSLLAFL